MSNSQVCFAPLPPNYADTANEDGLAAVERYTNDLITFLARHEAVHATAQEDFFTAIVPPSKSSCAATGDLNECKSTTGCDTDHENNTFPLFDLCLAAGEAFTARGDRLRHYPPLSAAAAAAMENTDECLQQPLTFEELASLVADGPPSRAPLRRSAECSYSPAHAALAELHATTVRLQLGRRYEEYPVEGVLRHMTAKDPSAASNSSIHSSVPTTAVTEERAALRVALLGRGMCRKKRHEAEQMEAAMYSLLRAVAKDTAHGRTLAAAAAEAEGRAQKKTFAGASSEPSGLTVMNVGEGKGYVSRVVSICSGVPVVGVDCNPLHKEGAIGRLETLLEVPSTATTCTGEEAGNKGEPTDITNDPNHNAAKRMVNIGYAARGRTTSVTCLVGGTTDWARVLAEGGVPVCAPTSSAQSENTAPSADPTPNLEYGGQPQRNTLLDKVQCRVCGKVLKVLGPAILLKHARQHYPPASDRPTTAADVAKARSQAALLVDGAAPMSSALTSASASAGDGADPEVTTTEDNAASAAAGALHVNLDEWIATLTQEALANRLRSELFSPFDIDAVRAAAAKGKGGDAIGGTKDDSTASVKGGKRPRDEEGGEAEEAGKAKALRGGAPVVSFARGEDVIVTCVASPASQPTPSSSATVETEKSSALSVVVRRRATILGYNDGAAKYKVLLHEGWLPEGAAGVPGRHNSAVFEGKAAMMGLGEGDTFALSATEAEFSALFRPQETPNANRAIHLKVEAVSTVPQPPLRSYPVRTPSLNNVALMGLHTCGDLGSAICRLFAEGSECPAMLLVSCCWRALTGGGGSFPMSSLVRGRGAALSQNQTREHTQQDSKHQQLRINGESLTLATQPFDSFAQESNGSDEHYGASRLLFFRSLFKRLWSGPAASAFGALAAGGGDAPHLSDTARAAFSVSCPNLSDREFHRGVSRDKSRLTFEAYCARAVGHFVEGNAPFVLGLASAARAGEGCDFAEHVGTFFRRTLGSQQSLFEVLAAEVSAEFASDHYFAAFAGLSAIRMWLAHIVEGLLLVDRLLYLAESGANAALVPLFDGAISPRLFAILTVRQRTVRGN